MNKNISIIVVILILVVVLAYLVWLRNRFQSSLSIPPISPAVESTPSPAPLILKIQESSPTAQPSAAKIATPSSGKK